MVGRYGTHASRDATTLTLPILLYRKAAALWGTWMGHHVADWTAAIDLMGKELHQWVGRDPGASGG